MRDLKRDFTIADPALAVGTRHAGFTVTSVEPLIELTGTAYIMRHDASGARAMWLAVDDSNKSFAIAFKTPPIDDTGVFHILEHSVLCGSDRFPVKEPFVNLIKTSMQTFLNAMTFPDKTLYPVASTNTTDLENLMDVYLDAVLHPAIYRRPRIFEQEGWHLEEAQDGSLCYNGVVYNEMKGALSDPDEVLMQALSRQLFPKSPYGFESGGDPASIPELSYERFLDTHSRHYDLANSYTILYGDLDIDRELAFVDERFADAPKREGAGPNPLVLQAGVTPAPSQVTMATTSDNAAVGIGYVLGTAADRERVLAADVLIDALAGSNEAPLKRRVLDAELADDFSVTLVDSILQPLVVFRLKGAKPGASERFRPLIEEACAELASNGIGRQRLVASLAQAEFNLREGDWGGYADGVALSMLSMASWLYDDERPVDYLRYQDAIDHMRSQLDMGYFERLLDELVGKSHHNAQMELVPVEAPGEADVRGAARLSELYAKMTEDDLTRVREEVEALRKEQEAPDRPEDLAKLPRLSSADIGPAPAEVPPARPEAPLPCLYHDLPTHHIDYVYHYFDLRRLSADDLPYAGLLCELLGSLDTATHTAEELDTLVEERLGNLSFFHDVLADDDDPLFADPMLVVGASALSENVEALATLPSEVWGSTSFADTGRIFDLLQQRRIAMEQGFVNSGHTAAVARLSTQLSNAAVASDKLAGVDAYLFLKDLLAHWDERKDELAERLTDLRRRIFTLDELTVSFTGPAEDLARFWELGGRLGLEAATDGRAAHVLELGSPTPKNEAFAIPSPVSYVTEGAPRSARDTTSIGAWQVVSRMLSFDYLWNEVRVKGGAYGVGFRRSTTGQHAFWSFRDPALDATLIRYENAAEWLHTWQEDAKALDGYVVSCVASHDTPLKSRQRARRQDHDILVGRPADWRDQVRDEILHVSAADVRAAGAVLADLPASRSVCVFGPAEAIDASTLNLQAYDLMDMQSASSG